MHKADSRALKETLRDRDKSIEGPQSKLTDEDDSESIPHEVLQKVI